MATPDAVTWHEQPWTDLADRLHFVHTVILPIGTTEAHGPHLPLETDVIIAVEAARRAASRLQERGVPTLTLPPLAYVVTSAAAPFAGTITITPGTLAALVTDIGRAVVAQGVDCLCLASAHLEPAHLRTLEATGAQLEGSTGCRVAVPDPRDQRWASRLGEEFQRGARHGSAYETSLVLAVRPDLVRQERLASLPPVGIDLPARLRAGATAFLEAGSLQGYFGDPATADPTEGHRLYDVLADMIATSVIERRDASR